MDDPAGGKTKTIIIVCCYFSYYRRSKREKKKKKKKEIKLNTKWCTYFFLPIFLFSTAVCNEVATLKEKQLWPSLPDRSAQVQE